MARVCELTGKRANNAFSISHSHRRTKRLQHANLQDKKIWWAEGNCFVSLKMNSNHRYSGSK